MGHKDSPDPTGFSSPFGRLGPPGWFSSESSEPQLLPSWWSLPYWEGRIITKIYEI